MLGIPAIFSPLLSRVKLLGNLGSHCVDSGFKSWSVAKASNTAEASYPRLTHPRLARCLKSMNLSHSELLERIGRGMLQVLLVQQLVEEQPEDWVVRL